MLDALESREAHRFPDLGEEFVKFHVPVQLEQVLRLVLVVVLVVELLAIPLLAAMAPLLLLLVEMIERMTQTRPCSTSEASAKLVPASLALIVLNLVIQSHLGLEHQWHLPLFLFGYPFDPKLFRIRLITCESGWAKHVSITTSMVSLTT